jgi:hypothetical protein
VGTAGVAAFLLVALVLPAEFSIDPLKTGRALGLVGLADAGRTVLAPVDNAHSVDAVEFELASFESVEYSYVMQQGQTLIFSWQASAEVVYNLHSSPEGGPADYAQSFASGRARQQSGTYTAPFNGRHGWFWENRNAQTLELQISTAGFVGESMRSAEGSSGTREPAPVFTPNLY